MFGTGTGDAIQRLFLLLLIAVYPVGGGTGPLQYLLQGLRGIKHAVQVGADHLIVVTITAVRLTILQVGKRLDSLFMEVTAPPGVDLITGHRHAASILPTTRQSQFTAVIGQRFIPIQPGFDG